MAFPSIQTGDTQQNHVTSNSTSWTLTYPTNLVSGDLILAFVACDGNPTATWPANWIPSNISAGGNAARLNYAKKISTGAESGNFTLSLGASEQGSWIVYRITNWHGTIGTAFVSDANSGDVETTAQGGSSQNPDAINLNANNWDVEDTLWFAAISVDTSRTISAFPTNCPDNQYSDPSGGSNGATLAVATANSATAAFNPDAYTISTSDDWAAATVAVRPAPPPAALPPSRDPWPWLTAVSRAANW